MTGAEWRQRRALSASPAQDGLLRKDQIRHLSWNALGMDTGCAATSRCPTGRADEDNETADIGCCSTLADACGKRRPRVCMRPPARSTREQVQFSGAVDPIPHVRHRDLPAEPLGGEFGELVEDLPAPTSTEPQVLGRDPLVEADRVPLTSRAERRRTEGPVEVPGDPGDLEERRQVQALFPQLLRGPFEVFLGVAPSLQGGSRPTFELGHADGAEDRSGDGLRIRWSFEPTAHELVQPVGSAAGSAGDHDLHEHESLLLDLPRPRANEPRVLVDEEMQTRLERIDP
jgi:hypothetical protein